jgi:hypothetical protein
MSTLLEFREEQDGISRAKTTAYSGFEVTIERHEREPFQAAGHFVPRMTDEHGRPRDWQGKFVYIGILNHELRDALGGLQSKVQVLRVYADTTPELFRMFDLRIRETFFAQIAAQQLQTADKDTIKRLADENNRLRAAAQQVAG